MFGTQTVTGLTCPTTISQGSCACHWAIPGLISVPAIVCERGQLQWAINSKLLLEDH